MKNLFLSGLIISVCMFSSCSTKDFKVNGQFEKDATGQVFLSKLTLEGLEPTDTVRFVDGAFTFKGSVEFPEVYVIFFEKKQDPILFIIENTNINISGNTNNLKDVEIKGSKLNDTYFRIIKEIPHQDEMEKLQESLYRAQMEGDQATMGSIIADGNVMMEDIKNYYMKCIRDNVNNVIGAYILTQAFQMISFEEFEEIVNLLKVYLPEHPYTVGLVEYVSVIVEQQKMYEKMMGEQINLQIGMEAPDFSLPDINGKDVNLKSFRGKYVLLDFWASWCRPCREENPNLVKLYKQYGGKNFEIISISVDQLIDDWKKAVKDDGLNWTMLFDPEGDVADIYGVETIPNTWLLDKEGKIINSNLPVEDLKKILEEIIK